MLHLIVLFSIYFAIQAQPVEDVYYQSAIVSFNYSNTKFEVVLVSVMIQFIK